MAWRVARSLDVLLGQLNALAPRRSKLSDGAIGDAAHATRTSDHNPWLLDSAGIGVVSARDFTHDPANGLDCNQLASWLIASGDRRIKYIIWNRRIWNPSGGWRPYTGTNPHDKHLHLSVSPTLYDSAAPWALAPAPAPAPKQEDDEMNANQERVLQEIANRTVALVNVAGRPIEAEARMTAKLDALTELVRQLAEKQGSPIDMDAVEAVVEKGVADAIQGIEATVTVKPGS